MAKICSKRRSMQIRIKLKRKEKLEKLRQKYIVSRASYQKEKILEKVNRLAPWLSKEEFLAPYDEGKKKD